jgi:aminomethyltransferase
MNVKTVLYDRHEDLGAKIVTFGGWEMPVQYPMGIVKEHLATRSGAGLFDVSHMGRFIVRGRDRLAFLQHVLTSNAAALDVGCAQYTLIPNAAGGAVDDAYLYRFVEDEYLLVVNAANAAKDSVHLQSFVKNFPNAELIDRTSELAMISLQGPKSKDILLGVLEEGVLPEPMRNCLSIVRINGAEVKLARTGYTGEPLCFELFVPTESAVDIWDLLIDRGAQPIGLGARDMLRLEAALPLYGHELGLDPDGNEIPIFASDLSRFAVSFSPLKGDFVGREALSKQFSALGRILNRHTDKIDDLPRRVVPFALLDRGVARAGYPVFDGDGSGKTIGHVTSGNMIPYWKFEGSGLASVRSDQTALRGIGLALIDSDVSHGDRVEIEVRGKRLGALITPYHLRGEAPPMARAILADQHTEALDTAAVSKQELLGAASTLLKRTVSNTIWRQNDCINLIPSEQTPSPAVRLLSVMDPAGRYAEHKPLKAFNDTDVFYYQGTGFIAQVEELLVAELARYFGCGQVETKVVSGQMANTAVFSAMIDFINRSDRKNEQRRMRSVLNNHIIRGGHLSAQPMGAMRDFVARDRRTEKPAVVNLPVCPDNPYKIDTDACGDILQQERPELIILGKSMVLHTEPVAPLRSMIDAMGLDTILMYDMAHVLGLIGPHFQDPFAEGADIVTGSTHKTFFGTQRGIIATDFAEDDHRFALWEAVQRRTFPGSVSNHHLGTMLGLLMAAYEMNAFKDEYQKNVIANAKTLARALDACGLEVAGDKSIGFTETHQVVVDVGYAKGPDIADRLEQNNIIVNYQATPQEEGFAAAGSLRLGVSEMTRFGMQAADFETLGQYMHDVIAKNQSVGEKVAEFRKQFTDMRYCFDGDDLDGYLQELHGLI